MRAFLKKLLFRRTGPSRMSVTKTSLWWGALRQLRSGDESLQNETEEDLLLRMVVNLIDEVEILKGVAMLKGGLSLEEQEAAYCRSRMWLMFSAAGATPPPIEKLISYLEDRNETAARLIPNEAERDAEIRHLSQLT